VSRKGIFITLEGNEGCGKSTQIRLLYDYLKKKGRPVFLTREPGGTRIGDGIRKILLDLKSKKMTPVCETLLYMASRAQLAEEAIVPKLKEGKIVLCDRWLDATVAYQGYGAGVEVRWIRGLGQAACRGLIPARTLFLELPLLAGLRRARKRKKADRMEQKALLFHKKVRAGYLKIAKAEPRRFKRIRVRDEDSISDVHKKIRGALSDVL